MWSRNATVAEGAGVTEQWIVHRTGVHERRHVSDGERLQDLAAAAGRAALEEANVAAEDLDLVLVATVAPDELLPNAAPLVARDLGATHAGAMDVGSACTGFLSALSLAAAQVEGGRSENVLVIGAEVLSRFVDSSDRGTAALFADGAGAARGGALERAAAASPTSSCTATPPAPTRSAPRTTSRSSTCRATTPSRRRSSGCPRPASRPRSARAWSLDEIDLFVYHQANARILTAVGERLGLDSERVINCIDRYGNTSSATLPIALADARERGMLEPGMNVLLAAFGAGFTWGAGVIEWGA